jgi:hypothetical protein
MFTDTPEATLVAPERPQSLRLLSLKTPLRGLLGVREPSLPLPGLGLLSWRGSGPRCPQVHQWPRPEGLNGGHEPAPS